MSAFRSLFRSLPARAASLPAWRNRVPLLCLVLMLSVDCTAELDAVDILRAPRCPDTPAADATHRQYAITGLTFPTSTDDFGEDINGDGKLDNLFGVYLSWGGQPGAFPSLDGESIEDLVNRQLWQERRGVLLMDVWAPIQRPGCVNVRLQQADSAPDAKSARWKVAAGSPKADLLAFGTHQAFATIPYSKMDASNAVAVDLFFPLETTAHHFRLHGARIVFETDEDGYRSGVIRGVVAKNYFEESIWPIWAQEMTESIHKYSYRINSDTDQNIAKFREYLEAIESQPLGKEKCKEAANCCFPANDTCYIYPKQLKENYNTTIMLDIAAFDAQGQWQLVRGPQTRPPDSASAAIGFYAEPVSFDSSCQARTFCPVDGPVPGTSYQGGWAQRSSDVWLMTAAGQAWHHDGLAFDRRASDLCESGATCSFGPAFYGTASDDIWVGGLTPGASLPAQLRHWDGGRWTSPALPNLGELEISAIYGIGPQNIWMTATHPKAARSIIMHYNGHSWESSDYSADLRSIWLSSSGSGWAGGLNGNLLQRIDGQWQAADLNRVKGVFGHNIRALVGNRDDNVWAFTGEQGSPLGRCWHFNGQEWRLAAPRGCEAPQRGYLTAWMDASGVIWAGGEKGLLRRYDPRRDMRFVDVPHAAGDSDIRVLFGSKEDGAVWAIAGSSSDVLMRYQP